MTQRRFLARGKAVAAAMIVSASVLAAPPAMAGPVTCADVPVACWAALFVSPQWLFLTLLVVQPTP